MTVGIWHEQILFPLPRTVRTGVILNKGEGNTPLLWLLSGAQQFIHRMKAGRHVPRVLECWPGGHKACKLLLSKGTCLTAFAMG